MKVYFKDNDGGNDLCNVEKDDIDSFVKFLKNLDTINLYIAEDYHIYGKVEEIMFVMDYTDTEIIETLNVYINKKHKK